MSLSTECPSSVQSLDSRISSLPEDDRLPPDSQFQGSPDHIDHRTDSDNNSAQESSQGSPLQRYIFRTVLLVTIPPLITVYFGILCWVYQVPNPEVNQYGHRNALWIYYSWFIIGVFGLGISKYGLIGIEAAMLQDRYWHARDTMALLMHGGQTWSGPGGWIKFLGIFLRKRKFPAHRLWWILSLLSLLVTIALPMSGLSMELFDGFVEAAHHPLVIGYFPETFNNKNDEPSVSRASLRWQVASSVNLPGAGIAYTPRGIDRGKYDYLMELPNSMSTEQDAPNLFLIPQAKYPVSGSAWGLRLSYNCSVVQSVSDLTILPKKNSLPVSSWITDTAKVGRGPFGDEVVSVYNTSVDNLFSYVELGAISNTSYMDDGAHLKADILEYVMWQVRIFTPIEDSGNSQYSFNNTIATPISGIGSPIMHVNGTFTPNATFLDIRQSNSYGTDSDALHQFVTGGKNAYEPSFAETAQPMGVRCQALSETGTARLNPDDLSFHDFTRVPPRDPEPIQHMRKNLSFTTKPFGWGPFQYLDKAEPAFTNLLSSTKQPPARAINISQAYAGYFQPKDLQMSLMRAYAVDALELMYDGLDTFEAAHVAENLTASQPGKILGPGAVPPHIPAIMLAIWALCCVLLGVGYGFRRRWAETLDVYSFLRFGADYANKIGDWPDVMGHYGEFYENGNLWNLQAPALIGDFKFNKNSEPTSLADQNHSHTSTSTHSDGD